MTVYNATFVGREKAAIGITYHIIAMVEAPNREAANLKLYDKYEHISLLNLKEITLAEVKAL